MQNASTEEHEKERSHCQGVSHPTDDWIVREFKDDLHNSTRKRMSMSDDRMFGQCTCQECSEESGPEEIGVEGVTAAEFAENIDTD